MQIAGQGFDSLFLAYDLQLTDDEGLDFVVRNLLQGFAVGFGDKAAGVFLSFCHHIVAQAAQSVIDGGIAALARSV